MSENLAPTPQQPTATLPEDTRVHVRALAHDLGNALEVIMQTSYLLGTLDLGENGKEWHKMLDAGVAKAAKINQELRAVLRAEG